VAGFSLRDGVLACEGVSLVEVARTYGTPTYVYSGPAIDERLGAFDAPFAGVPHRVHYAIKANATSAILRRIRAWGAGADANSGGEIELALRTGFAPGDIVFTGVGKTRAELTRAIGLGLSAINAESFGEIARISELAAAVGREARVAVRINPDVEAGTHRHISTGARTTKFGVSIDEARPMIADLRARPGVKVIGLHVHLGSQLTSQEAIARAVGVVADFAADLMSHGLALEHLDVGGGLGIPYRPGQAVLSPEAYAAAVIPVARRTGLSLVLEPGRWIVGPSGALLTSVVDLKPRPDGGWFVIVDAGMNDLIRPALYEAWHAVDAVTPRPGAPICADVVGPVCETADTLATNRELPPVEVGDLLLVRDAGAYGSVMASNYNRRPLSAEVLVDAEGAHLIRRRQTVDDMLQWDV
jgi:diaminopimelate decarboxylase